MPQSKGARHANLGGNEMLLPENNESDKANDSKEGTANITDNVLAHRLDATAAAMYMTSMSLQDALLK